MESNLQISLIIFPCLVPAKLRRDERLLLEYGLPFADEAGGVETPAHNGVNFDGETALVNQRSGHFMQISLQTFSLSKQSYQKIFADCTKLKFFTGTKFRKGRCTKNCTKNCASTLKTTLNSKIGWRFYRKILVFQCSNYQCLG